jgi:hypothetical protein
MEIEEPLLDETLDDLVEELGEARGALAVIVAVAAERVEHLGGELPAVHERLQDRLAQRVEGLVAFVIAELTIERIAVAAGESRLEEEVGELVEQRLQVDGVGLRGGELGVGVLAHSAEAEWVQEGNGNGWESGVGSR